MKALRLETRLNHSDIPHGIGRSPRRSFLLRVGAVLAVAAMSWLPLAGQAGAVPGIGGKKSLNVYFSNAYIGANIDRVLEVDPGDMQQVIQATTLSYQEIVQSEPPKRMAALAAAIIDRDADVVGLAEIYSLQVAEMASPTQLTTIFDFLDLLTQSLAARGGHYQVAVVSTESAVTLPVYLEGRVKLARLVDHEAILVRSDLHQPLRYDNAQTGHFENHIVLPEAGIDLLRGWCSIDMNVRGERFRLLCSHLETEAVPQLQYAQARELLAGPADTTLPVLLMGDFNTDPLGRDGSFTYPLFGQAGFADTWNVLNPHDPAGGLTWGHDALLADPSVKFDRRIDLILYRGARFAPASLVVVNPKIGTTAPLWFSDHAGVSSVFHLGNPTSFKNVPVVHNR